MTEKIRSLEIRQITDHEVLVVVNESPDLTLRRTCASVAGVMFYGRQVLKEIEELCSKAQTSRSQV